MEKLARSARWLFVFLFTLVLGILAWRYFRPQPAPAPRTGEPDFRVAQQSLSDPVRIVAYGDMRFTDPAETEATNPKVRRWLVERIAVEKPDAVLLSGDLPWHGGDAGDYAVYSSETPAWRDAHLRLYPALGNHELSGGLNEQCLANWWRAFPQLQGLRYYSVLFGKSILLLSLDSNSDLTPHSQQITWLSKQLAGAPRSVHLVLLNLHHPPVVDVQANGDDSHNGRPNEAALAAFLAASPLRSRVRFVVIGGHIHNYERFYRDGIVYIVSGGGGAKPRPVERGPADLYQDPDFPNYHYVRLTVSGNRLDGAMIRVADPAAPAPGWQEKDYFSAVLP